MGPQCRKTLWTRRSDHTQCGASQVALYQAKEVDPLTYIFLHDEGQYRLTER